MPAVWISRHVATLEEGCFRECRNLQIMAFEAGSHLRDVGRSAFSNCDSLRSIAIPSSVRVLGPQSFCHCQSFGSMASEVVALLAMRFWLDIRRSLAARARAVAHEGQLFEVRSVSTKACGFGRIAAASVSGNVASLGDRCFFGCGVLDIVAFEGGFHLREIELDAFSGCALLQSIAFPALLVSGQGVFTVSRLLDR
jgi:hypothetical protein